MENDLWVSYLSSRDIGLAIRLHSWSAKIHNYVVLITPSGFFEISFQCCLPFPFPLCLPPFPLLLLFPGERVLLRDCWWDADWPRMSAFFLFKLDFPWSIRPWRLSTYRRWLFWHCIFSCYGFVWLCKMQDNTHPLVEAVRNLFVVLDMEGSSNVVLLRIPSTLMRFLIDSVLSLEFSLI